MYKNQILGKRGEEIACKYLKKSGYKVLMKNFRCRQGEIDIIAQDKDEIVFFEVKTRINLICGLPSEAVNKRKKKHIINVSKYYIYINNLENINIRYDVIEIYKKDKYYVNHIKNIDIFK